MDFCLFSLLCLSTIALLGCDYPFPGKPNRANRPVPEDQVMSFDKLFARNCAGCHGVDGKLGPAPPLNDPLFLAIVSEEELLHVLEYGRPVTPMPPFARAGGGPLTAEQVLVLVGGLQKHWGAYNTPGDVPPYAVSQNSIDELPGDAERGTELFATACAGCHGENGKSDDSAINDPAFLALISDQALRRIIITGRPDLGMPNFRETDGRDTDFKPLDSAQINDLVALLAKWREGK